MLASVMNDQLIISIKEFRKLTGRATQQFSDEQITEFITQLDFIAELFVKRVRKDQPPMKQN